MTSLAQATQRGLEKYAAIVVDASTGQVIEAENPDKICHPASLTKIMTLYCIFEAVRSKKIRLHSMIPVSHKASRQAPSKLGLRPGEYVSVENVIKGLATKSANDAACALAEHLGEGSESRFAAMMTQKARILGMRRTIFRNASGLPHPEQVTTARDMATLSLALLRNFPTDYRHFRLKSFSYKGREHRNHNHLLGKVHGTDGIKTGFINASGFNLVASAVRTDAQGMPRRLVVVVMGGPNRFWRDRRVTELLEKNFQRMGAQKSDSRQVSLEQSEEDCSPKNIVQNAVDLELPDEQEIEQQEDQEELVRTVTHVKEPVKPTDIIPVTFEEPVSNSKKKEKSPVNESPTLSSQNYGPITVQLGTYSSKKQARDIAKIAHQNHKTKGVILLPSFTNNKKRQYAAQIANITPDIAEKICHEARQKGGKCVIMEAAPPSKPAAKKRVRKKMSTGNV